MFGNEVPVADLNFHVLFCNAADGLGSLDLHFKLPPLVVPGVVSRPEAQNILILEVLRQAFHEGNQLGVNVSLVEATSRPLGQVLVAASIAAAANSKDVVGRPAAG